MTDPAEKDIRAPVFNMAEAVAKFSPIVDNSKSSRKKRHRIVTDSVDRRSLRATGRTEQFNFKSTPGLHARAKAIAAHHGKALSEWMDEIVSAAIEAAEKELG